MSSQSVRQAGQLFSLGDILTGIFQRCDERVKDKISPKYLTLIHVNDIIYLRQKYSHMNWLQITALCPSSIMQPWNRK